MKTKSYIKHISTGDGAASWPQTLRDLAADANAAGLEGWKYADLEVHPKGLSVEYRQVESETDLSIAELLDALEQGADSIPIREQVNGKWGNYTLSELPGNVAVKHICRMIRRKLKTAEQEAGTQ